MLAYPQTLRSMRQGLGAVAAEDEPVRHSPIAVFAFIKLASIRIWLRVYETTP